MKTVSAGQWHLGLALLACSGSALAHEMFLKPADYFPKPGTETVVTLVNGTFEQSENPIARERMADVSLLGPAGVAHPAPTQWRDTETESLLRLKPAGEGTYVVGVSTRAKVLEMKAKEFDDYLLHEGVPDTYAARKAAGVPATPVRERYSKHVRSFLQVGAQRSEDYARPLGYPVEIIPAQNPTVLKAGDEFAFTVLYKGKPVANQLVQANYDGHHGHDDDGNHTRAYSLRTDAEGRARFKLTRGGQWYLGLIHMEKIDQPDADYESNWATATFAVR